MLSNKIRKRSHGRSGLESHWALGLSQGTLQIFAGPPPHYLGMLRHLEYPLSWGELHLQDVNKREEMARSKSITQ